MDVQQGKALGSAIDKSGQIAEKSGRMTGNDALAWTGISIEAVSIIVSILIAIGVIGGGP